MYKVGDYVKVKNGSVLKTGELIQGWHGRITGIHTDNTCSVRLDAPSLDSLELEYVLGWLREEIDIYEHRFRENRLEAADRRDTDAAYKKAVDSLEARTKDLERLGDVSDFESDKEDWIEGFHNSPFYYAMGEKPQRYAGHIIRSFLSFIMKDGSEPNDWTVKKVNEVCLVTAPKYMTAQIRFFQSYGISLIHFLRYLEESGIIANAKPLQDHLYKIKDKIPVVAMDPKNWEEGKLIMMNAQKEGVDLTDEKKLKDYYEYHINKDKRAAFGQAVNPLKGIGRNDRVTVKFKNGEILEGVKFKKVEQDLKKGLCELVK